MVVDGEKSNSAQYLERRQHARRHALAAAILVVALILSGCMGKGTRPDMGSVAHDAEAQLPPRPAIGVHEDQPLDASKTPHSQLPPAIWQRLRAGFRLADIEHPRIEHEIRRLQHAPDAFRALMVRSEPYLYHILNEIEDAGLPTELALLPAVESGFRPFAYSPDGAAGLWQFMPATGRMMGLKQSWWFDKRRSIRASTDAAIAYLNRLYERFDGDWLHALAAYNAGSAKVGRAIRQAKRRRKPSDFWSLDLPGETDRYVPRLLALADVVSDPQKYGLELPYIFDQPYFSIASTAGQIDLNVAAGAAGLPVKTLLGLNAGHRRWATDPDGPHELLVPAAKADAFEIAVAALEPDKRLRWQRHEVRPGDSLNRIARHYDVTVDAIRRSNGLKNSRLRAGSHLLIPLSDPVSPATTGSHLQSRQRLRYRVRKGDSLYTIARRFQVSIRDLKRWNRVGRYIRPGERLTVFIDPDA